MTADTDDSDDETRSSSPRADDETLDDDAPSGDDSSGDEHSDGSPESGLSGGPSGTDTAGGPSGDHLAAGEAGERTASRAQGGDGSVAGRDRIDELEAELAAVREDLDAFESHVDERTLHRDEIEDDLKGYVRKRQRRGHATGWGPYLVLLYGTVMTLGAFYYLGGLWAILAMIVVWLSTLGLFVVMLLTGVALGTGRRLGGLFDLVRGLR